MGKFKGIHSDLNSRPMFEKKFNFSGHNMKQLKVDLDNIICLYPLGCDNTCDFSKSVKDRRAKAVLIAYITSRTSSIPYSLCLDCLYDVLGYSIEMAPDFITACEVVGLLKNGYNEQYRITKNGIEEDFYFNGLYHFNKVVRVMPEFVEAWMSAKSL